jgi:RecB family exonuclease
VITPRTTRLIRVPDQRTFQRAILDRLGIESADARACAVIVPSRTSAEELRRAVPADIDVALFTRDELYEDLAHRLSMVPLSALEREVILRRAASEASASGAEPPFRLRAGLVVEMLALYDELRRHGRTVADFDRLLTGSLEHDASHDRGAARLLEQTAFLTAAFVQFEARIGATGRTDEHGIRAAALGAPEPLYRSVVVTTGDQASDRHGLWTADFDLLARIPGLERLDIVATEARLAAGLHQRLHDLLPGLEEVRLTSANQPPILVVPDASGTDAPRAFVFRDREEELAGVARWVKDAPHAAHAERMAVVFQRPLPYVYLASQVFADARLPYQAYDSLPLAAEPFAAAIDLVFGAIGADFTRSALVELLRSPHLGFGPADAPLDRRDVAALDRLLVDRKFLGSIERLEKLAADATADASPKRWPRRAVRALEIAAAAARELHAAIAAGTAADQIHGLLSFVAEHERLPAPEDEWYARHMRARAAVLGALRALEAAHSAHDAERLSIGQLSGMVRRWIEGQTFSPRFGEQGLRLMDAAAAAFADVDDLRIVGLVEGDWPERSHRSIFYPQALLSQLGWPSEQDRLAEARAQFQDLLSLPRRRVSLSTFSLEDDALVSPSPLIEDVDAAGLVIERHVPSSSSRAFVHEALAIEPVDGSVLSEAAAAWLDVRVGRTFEDRRFQGYTHPRPPAAYGVSYVEQYAHCPFRYFAAHVLKLPEERDEQGWMTPQERGQFVHAVFCEFFERWQAEGRGAITPENVADAIESFSSIAERHLDALPEGDRALERTLLLGSAVSSGLAERAFAFEVEQGVPVIERLLEHELERPLVLTGADGEAVTISVKAKADRIDLLEDGTLRIIDYKLGRAPARDRALQLPIYGTGAVQALDGRHGRHWTVGRAGYVAFRERQPFVPLGRTPQDLQAALADGQSRFVAAVQGIEAGAFPVQPAELFLCNWCPYPSVCRKDYVGDE